jgi:hypothetical protein
LAFGRLSGSAYPSPERAEEEMARLATAHADLCRREVIGESTEGRPIHAFRLRGREAAAALPGGRPRVLVTAHMHAVEYVGAYVARAVARRLVEGYEHADHVTALLDRADVFVVPLLNPDGAQRVWRRDGWSLLGWSRFTATGVDPNRNFPFGPLAGRAGWNSGSDRPGSAYYRGPRPLSEPECLALARLARREHFCAAINFHSFGGVVFMPAVAETDREKAERAFAVFEGIFQSRQLHRRYRPVPERSAAIVGQLDPFLLNAFGTVSVTVEVSRLGWHLLLPWYGLKIFWWANPPNPERWVDNDTDAAVHALLALVERMNGTPCASSRPELARWED